MHHQLCVGRSATRLLNPSLRDRGLIALPNGLTALSFIALVLELSAAVHAQPAVAQNRLAFFGPYADTVLVLESEIASLRPDAEAEELRKVQAQQGGLLR